MSATSVLSPAASTTSRAGWLRLVVVFAIVVFSVAAFAVGRVSAHSGSVAPKVAPASITRPSPSASITDGCGPGRPRC